MHLNLPSITVSRIEEKHDQDYHVYAIPSSEPQCCFDCISVALYRHGTKTSLYMDTPMHGRRVGILLERKRYKCRSCGITFLQRCDDINDKHRATNRLVSYVENNGLIKTFTSIADEIGIAESTVRNIVSIFIGRLEKNYRFEPPVILGIDEVHLNRQMRLVLTNIGENTIVDLVGSRKKQFVISALYRFKTLKQIKFVTMDMWRPYRDAVTAVLPHAVIVIDKFHVVKMANEAVEKGRKDLRGQMTSGEVKLLKKDRFLMLRRRRDLDTSQEFLLSGWTENYPLLHDLYQAKEQFYDIWDSNLNRKEAEIAYLYWKDNVPSDICGYFSDLDRAITNWHTEVFNYFDHRITNAYTESANNHIKSIARQGRGYSFDVLRARTLFTNAKHKVKRKSFKAGVREDTACYGLPNSEEFLNFGVIIPHDHEK
ncbi:MAG: ISL3 family transposase [Methyloglobulus sp.]|nr:ISL3 family transposase [Methyloglobulus sp.]